MKKFLLIFIAYLLLFLIGCSGNDNDEVTSLFPSEAGFTWIYSGFAEYGHEMTLNNIVRERNQVTYKISGKVYDPSDGEARGNYNITMEYILSDGALIMNKEAEKMMDCEFDNMILIKSPLKEGTTWTQNLISRDKQEMKLVCSIVHVKNGENKVYTVRYEHPDSSYYQERQFEENKGLISFRKLFATEDMVFEIGYDLYEIKKE